MEMELTYNFGALLVPPGYCVKWFSCHEHYQGIGPDEWESPITCDPHQALSWCWSRYRESH